MKKQDMQDLKFKCKKHGMQTIAMYGIGDRFVCGKCSDEFEKSQIRKEAKLIKKKPRKKISFFKKLFKGE